MPFVTEGTMSSNSMEWGTPQDLYDSLNDEFRFDIDVCATEENHKHKKYWTKEDDALIQDWSGKVCFMNPPYGREIGKFMAKAANVSKWNHGRATVVCLVPARTDTEWWQYCWQASEIRFIRGRLKYVNGTKDDPAPFPSAIVVFRPESRPYPICRPCDKLGRVERL